MDNILIALAKIYNEPIRSTDGLYYRCIESGGGEIDLTVIQSQIDAEIAKITAEATYREQFVYLKDTDWIVSKISESIIDANQTETDALKVKYATQLQQRKDARVAINAYEASL